MKIEDFFPKEGEKPLEMLKEGGGMCSILRTVACIGDSLSSGEHESFEMGEKGFHDYFDYSWGQFMARDAGITVHNMSRGGMTAKDFDIFARENGFFDDKYKANAYIIALGVNDVSHITAGELEMGDLSDIDPSEWAHNKPTFAGYYARIIAKFQDASPEAKFFLMTIPDGETDEKRAALCKKHRELLYGMAKLFKNCYVLDFYKYAPVYDKKFKEMFFLGGHMNAAGYRLTALMTETYIDWIIRNNYQDFARVAFMNKRYHNA